jgi:hypothetical protein
MSMVTGIIVESSFGFCIESAQDPAMFKIYRKDEHFGVSSLKTLVEIVGFDVLVQVPKIKHPY